jgi:hypothetical protein
MERVVGSARSWRKASTPLIPGNWTSIKTRAGCWPRASCTPSSPGLDRPIALDLQDIPHELEVLGIYASGTHTIGRPVLVDGVVDRVLNGVKLSPNKFIWTMVMLNITMGQVTGDELWDAWWKEPSVPPLLRDKIRDPATFF